MASEKIVKLIEDVKTLTVLELSELVKALEEEFGVSASAPVAVAAVGAAPAAELKKKQNLTLYLLTLAQTKWLLSKQLKTLAVSDSKRQKTSLTTLPKLLKKQLPRLMLNLSRQNLKKLALKSNLSNLLRTNGCGIFLMEDATVVI